MRKIQFRGKCSHCDAWAYGSLVDFGEDEAPEIHGFDPYREGDERWREITADRDTIGQFTGMTDKNGVGIFEGDIVRWDRDQRLYVVVFRNGMFYASVEECNSHIYGGFPLWFLCEEEQHCAIVGNIYDNTELLSIK